MDIQWDELQESVKERIGMLRAIDEQGLSGGEDPQKVRREIVIPLAELLGEFVAGVHEEMGSSPPDSAVEGEDVGWQAVWEQTRDAFAMLEERADALENPDDIRARVLPLLGPIMHFVESVELDGDAGAG